MFSPIPRGAQIVLLTLVLCAALFDARYRRIPNWLTVSGVVTGVALNSFLYSGPAGFFFALKGLGLGFGVYFALHLLHAMGAGDVKLMAAVGSITGASDWFGIFMITAVVGGFLSIVVSIAKRRLGKTLFNVGFILSEMRSLRPAYLKNEELDVKSDKALRLPHGVVIAVGTLIFLALSARFTQ
ncbi:MAG TPA: A24 family peptidase [Candidatus Acidoferrum sp.]|jgi:prepilin peptidase CpaA|nr:A24 family peptidase [Candidatus Acidoferrum sp.]